MGKSLALLLLAFPELRGLVLSLGAMLTEALRVSLTQFLLSSCRLVGRTILLVAVLQH